MLPIYGYSFLLLYHAFADTPDVVREIVSYATARGVRTVAELDLPGHSVGLQRGAPAVYANCSSPSKLPDPTTEDFFTFLDSIVAEMGTLFPDNYIHMGGDEVRTIDLGPRFLAAQCSP